MNKLNDKLNGNKSQSNPVPMARDSLETLYGQMSAAGHGPDHPWCLALAGIISAHEDEAGGDPNAEAIDIARKTVDIAETAMCFVGDSIQPVINALEALADFNTNDPRAFQRRMGEIHALAKVARRISEDAHNLLDCEREDMVRKLTALQGGRA